MTQVDPAPEPIDLDDLQKLYDLAEADDALPSWRSAVYLRVPELIAELREARQRIAAFEALEKREDWTVTPSRDDVPTSNDPLKSMFSRGDLAEETARRNGWQLWRQRSLARPWEPIDSDPPF